MKPKTDAKRSPRCTTNDWYDDEPNYDSLSDEVLDELYYADAPTRKKVLNRIYQARKSARRLGYKNVSRAKRSKTSNSPDDDLLFDDLPLDDWSESYDSGAVIDD